MLAHHRRTVYLSLISTNLPVWQIIESSASLYQKEQDKFHLLLNQRNFSAFQLKAIDNQLAEATPANNQGVLWLELSPYRVILTMQGQSQLSYRHFWERGVYGVSRYWLNSNLSANNNSLRLRNFTRYLKLEGHPLPTNLQVEYELWSAKLPLGSFVMHLDIDL